MGIERMEMGTRKEMVQKIVQNNGKKENELVKIWKNPPSRVEQKQMKSREEEMEIPLKEAAAHRTGCEVDNLDRR